MKEVIDETGTKSAECGILKAREQYFKEQRVLNVDSKSKKREDGKWPLYIETWKTLLVFQRATGEGCLVCL